MDLNEPSTIASIVEQALKAAGVRVAVHASAGSRFATVNVQTPDGVDFRVQIEEL